MDIRGLRAAKFIRRKEIKVEKKSACAAPIPHIGGHSETNQSPTTFSADEISAFPNSLNTDKLL